MTAATDTLSLTFAALADPTRRAILERLTRGAATVNELAAPFAMSQPAISKHLKVLEKAGLITRGRQAQARPAELNAQQLELVTRWLEKTRTHWEESFDKLDSYLATLQDTPPDPQTPTPPRRKK
ncbi:MAG: winged helix-turn-helix transcriptional regulator [Anaerolineales bacterium]|nr:winged helix-turn-helix transcriptional regulator [Anaerolineales bacterium]HRN51189.1 metalloregulator ArsR/SmtB family transcription factor [Anaerolineales bacterium]HRQ93202.1 metalloregulator ArsR/SmtB family transcription factor [Anaerolineales bacterium]